MREGRGERAAWGRVFGKHLELLWLQVGLAADPLAQGGDTVTCFHLELAEMALLHHQFLPLGLLQHTHAVPKIQSRIQEVA